MKDVSLRKTITDRIGGGSKRIMLEFGLALLVILALSSVTHAEPSSESNPNISVTPVMGETPEVIVNGTPINNSSATVTPEATEIGTPITTVTAKVTPIKTPFLPTVFVLIIISIVFIYIKKMNKRN